MDGNARWAMRKGQQVHVGHENGVPSLRTAVRCCKQWGVQALTVYAFSSENLGRGQAEVVFLMQLMARVLQQDTPELADEGVRLHFIGEVGDLPETLRNEIQRAETKTSACCDLHLTIAINYGGRQEIAAAARALAERVAKGTLDPSDISVESLDAQIRHGFGHSNKLPAGVPVSPDLLIRTSGEKRLSNFLLWEAAYAELYFTDTLWPDFGEEEFRTAISDFAARQGALGGGELCVRSQDRRSSAVLRAASPGSTSGSLNSLATWLSSFL
eukprot:CAMPEP_0117690466 /NCGR_PEP_ID=MMETSP0804-20121206/25141_1 /TAXON_ID=1074897 /ORGANISM="Tetraselmis astigmatica, Strain CCMP880" /LENGTH=270 /DNA_ID=CAMNT_0005503513 /DNA_START=489 /DNA_END=1302 /DNA_ORIENTATION=+